MRNYEVTFIIDPVLTSSEIKETAKIYVDHLKNEGCEIVHVNDMGLRQLAYPIKKRSSGIYQCVEFKAESGTFISKFELSLRRDERIMRFLTVYLDKFGVKYNDDKRNGVILAYKGREVEKEEKKEAPRPTPAKSPAPVPVQTPVSEPVEVPVSEPVEVPVPEPVEVPVSEPVEVSVSEPVEIPVSEPAEIPVSEPAEVPVSEPVIVVEPTPAPVSKSEEE